MSTVSRQSFFATPVSLQSPVNICSLPLPNKTVGVQAFSLDTPTGTRLSINESVGMYAVHADLHADCERLRLGRGRPLKSVFELRKVIHRSF